MKIRSMVNQWRPLPEKLSLRRELCFSLCVLLLGLFLGYAAKATDAVSLIGEIGTNLSVWVFVASLIAAYSRHPISAAVNVLVFFLAMLFAYYLYGQLVLGFFPRAYMAGWLVIALISPFPGAVLWFARGKGFPASVIAALPTAVTFVEGYPAFYTGKPVLAAALVFGVLLAVLLPKTWWQRGVALASGVLLAFFLVQLGLLDYLPF